MKKVLIISYYWPPAGGPGSQRAVKFAKYLPQFGWRPVILTVKNGEFAYLDHSLEKETGPDCVIYHSTTFEPFIFYKKLTGKKPTTALPVGQLTQKTDHITEKMFRWLRTQLFVPDARAGWIFPGYLRAKKIIRQEKIQAVFSSSPPHSLQLMAYLVKKEFKLPWVADFRDPWTDIQYYKVSQRSVFTRILDQYFENLVLREADSITTVSRSIGKSFQEKVSLGLQKEKTVVIPNGWDPDEFQEDSKPDSIKFDILHTGNLNATQNPMVLWKSLQSLLNKVPGMGTEVRLRFIGRIHESILKSIEAHGLTAITEKIPFLPHQQVIREISKASLLLSVVPDVPDNNGIVMSKNFEYIGSGLPIMVIGPPQSDIGLIISQFSHSKICDYTDQPCCEKYIRERYRFWKDRKNTLSSREQREQFSRVVLTRRLAEVLNSIS